MKCFSLGSHGYVSLPTCEILGANTQHRQADVLVFARSKAEAFNLLGARGMAPSRVTDPQFRGATGDVPAVLERAGLADAPAVFALHNRGVGTVVRIEQDGSPTVVGEVEREGDSVRAPLRFVPTPAGVAGSVFTEPMTQDEFVRMMEYRTRGDVHRVADACGEAMMSIAGDPARWDVEAGLILPAAIPGLIAEAEAHLEQEELSAEDFAGQCRANVELVKRLTEQLAEARTQRRALARTAVDRDFVPEAAEAFDVSAGRIYQLRDEHLVAEANERNAKLRRSNVPGHGRFQSAAR